MAMSEYIALDDERVTRKITRPGKMYTREGLVETAEGLHVEPRMDSVAVGSKSWFMSPGDDVELEIEDISLLGIVHELAEHHYDMALYIDGQDVFRGFGSLSGYMPSSDGMGVVHWIMLSKGPHHVRVEVSSQHNRMLVASGTRPTHACLSGFITLGSATFPPPVYSNWMYSQQPLPSKDQHAAGYLRAGTIPPGGHLYLMDLPGQGTLDSLNFVADQPLVLEIMDGGAAEPGIYPYDFPSWARRVAIPWPEASNAPAHPVGPIRTYPNADGATIIANMTREVCFASRLIVRLFNPGTEVGHLSQMYMEGTIRLR
jgi:hypothetical protein